MPLHKCHVWTVGWDLCVSGRGRVGARGGSFVFACFCVSDVGGPGGLAIWGVGSLCALASNVDVSAVVSLSM